MTPRALSGRAAVAAYIRGASPGARRRLRALRATARAAAPEAEDALSYRMPALRQGGILLWYGAFRDHVALFPRTAAIRAFRDELKPYRASKGTIRFPHDRPLPLNLIRRIVRFVARRA